MNKKKTLTKKDILYFIDYEHREEALQLARRMKNLTLPLENHLHIYTGRQHISRQRRMKREEAASA